MGCRRLFVGSQKPKGDRSREWSSAPFLPQSIIAAHLDDLPLLTHVCRHLGLCDLIRVSQSCKGFRHGRLETAELPTESPVVAVLLELALPRLELVPRTRPFGCSEA
jgi:hypothetical protein